MYYVTKMPNDKLTSDNLPQAVINHNPEDFFTTRVLCADQRKVGKKSAYLTEFQCNIKNVQIMLNMYAYDTIKYSHKTMCALSRLRRVNLLQLATFIY